MKRFLIYLILAFSCSFIYAAPFRFLPCTIIQPNGEKIACYVSGDEYYNWLHDMDGYTIIQANDGYYYYAKKEGAKLIASEYKVNKVKPESTGMIKWLRISEDEYFQRKQKYMVPSRFKSLGPNHAPHTDILNNIVIYIRFSDEPEITTTRETYDNQLNPETGSSLKSYYNEVSYNHLSINSTHYPVCENPSTTNASFEDSHKRGYFQPYNETTNPIGYKNDSESSAREHQLLADAINWINANSPIPAEINIDGDDDGQVDNVCFMIKGNSGGWSDLLWAHRWSLYSKNVSINGKRVYDYTFQPENQVNVGTLCHEMFHALGAPDLYHYDDEIFDPVGTWDIMCYGEGHMSAYMKWKYAGSQWITSIPEITVSGTYTLNPLTSATNNCYKIASPNSSSEFFVVEYRKKTAGTFDNSIPGSGLLVYRINTNFEGNASFDNTNIFDEVYLYRRNGTNKVNGSISLANFSSNVNRTVINDASNPSSFLHNGTVGGLDISNISTAGDVISFDVYISNVEAPVNPAASGVSESQIDLSWELNSDNNDVLVVYSETGTIGSPTRGTNYSAGNTITGGGTVLYAGNATTFSHSALSSGTNYFYRIWSKNSSNEYSNGVSFEGATNCVSPAIPYIHGFNEQALSPCWSIEVVAEGEVQDEPASITQVESGTTPDASPYEGSHMIKFNSTYCGAGNVLRLESPVFSTVDQSGLDVKFSWHQDNQWIGQYEDYMTIQWSIDGSTWHDGPKYQRCSSITRWTQQKYTLPAEALGQQNIQIAFQFTSKYGFNCYMDNLKIESNTTSVDHEMLEMEMLVFPNPSKGLFQIQPDASSNSMNIEVKDVTGKTVYSKHHQYSDKTIDLSNCTAGIYFMLIKTDKKTYNHKIVIE